MTAWYGKFYRNLSRMLVSHVSNKIFIPCSTIISSICATYLTKKKGAGGGVEEILKTVGLITLHPFLLKPSNISTISLISEGKKYIYIQGGHDSNIFLAAWFDCLTCIRLCLHREDWHSKPLSSFQAAVNLRIPGMRNVSCCFVPYTHTKYFNSLKRFTWATLDLYFCQLTSAHTFPFIPTVGADPKSIIGNRVYLFPSAQG